MFLLSSLAVAIVLVGFIGTQWFRRDRKKVALGLGMQAAGIVAMAGAVTSAPMSGPVKTATIIVLALLLVVVLVTARHLASAKPRPVRGRHRRAHGQSVRYEVATRTTVRNTGPGAALERSDAIREGGHRPA